MLAIAALGPFLAETVTLLAAAVGVVLVSHRLRMPPVVGLLLAGVLIGPSGLGWIDSAEEVELFAEIGVALLLFAIGLELSFAQLRELRRPFLIGGSVQAGLTLVAAAAWSWSRGAALPEATFFGFVAILSSTAMVLKIYADRRETESPQGRLVLGILLFQDLLIVPLIVLTPLLGGAVEASPAALALRFGLALAGIGLVFVAARWVLPRVLHLLVGTRAREVLVLGSLAICLSMAWLTYELGFSLALGAFLAGLLVSESEYSHQIIADVGPFRDVLASVFFVSVGMLVDLQAASEMLPAILGTAAVLVALKALAAGIAVKLLRYPARVATIVGLGLAQIGEFSFVLLEVGRNSGLLTDSQFQLLLAVAVSTLVVTPLFIRFAPAVGRLWSRLPRRRGSAEASGEDEAETPLEDHVLVVGYGAAGRILSRILAETRIPYRILELNGDTVRRGRREGLPILYGDAARRDVLEAAGIEHAGIVVFVISDPWAQERSVRLCRRMNPGVEILVRTRRLEDIDRLRAAGADQVIAEELETTVELFTRTLAHYHVPRNVIRAQSRILRGESYRMLRTLPEQPEVSEAVLEALEAGTTDVFQVTTGSAAAGRNLRELDLRGRTGVTVIAVVRGETSWTNPSPDRNLEPGDCLVLVGSHEEIDRAFRTLAHGQNTSEPS